MQTRRAWTTGEVAFLRSAEGRAMTAAECGRVLGRSAKAISNARVLFGVRINSRWLARDDQALARVRELAGAGLYDREIAQRLGCCRRAVGRLREYLGLATVRRAGGRYGRMRSAIYKRTCSANGCRSLATLGRVKRAIARLRQGEDFHHRATEGTEKGEGYVGLGDSIIGRR